MGKLPAFLFYPGDWRKDPALQSCSLAARGLWTELLCLMFECPERGELSTFDGRPWTAKQIARAVGAPVGQVTRLLAELIDTGTVTLSDKAVITSRKQKRDQVERVSETKRKATYRETNRLEQNVPVDVPPVSRPSSITSSSSSSFRDKPERTPLVFLSDSEMDSLSEKMTPKELSYWLTELSEAATKNPVVWKKKYKDHASVVRSWRRRRLEDGKLWDESQGLYVKPAGNGYHPQKRLSDLERAALRDAADEEKQKRGERYE